MPDIPLLAPLALAEPHFLAETVVSFCIGPTPSYAWPKLSNLQNLLREVHAAEEGLEAGVGAHTLLRGSGLFVREKCDS